MALLAGQRVRETSTTTGTGTLDLSSYDNHQTFVVGIGNANTCHYLIVDTGETDWEIGIGTVTDATPDTLARTSVLASSNSNAAVNWGAGTKHVMNVLPGSISEILSLLGIEAGATADQTGAQIKTLYESESNAFTDTKNTKLTNIETAATADQTGAQIKTAYEAEANAYTDTKNTKLSGIATGAEVNESVISQGDAEAGTSTVEKTWTSERVKQAIEAQAGALTQAGLMVAGAI